MLRNYGSSNRGFGGKLHIHSGLGQKHKETLKKGLKAGVAAAALVGGIALTHAGVNHAQEVRREGSRTDLLGDLSAMKGPIQKTTAFENMPDKPVFAPAVQPLLTPSPAVAPAGGKDIAKVAVKGIAGVVAGSGNIGSVVKNVAGAVADKGQPEGQNIIDQVRKAEIDSAAMASKVIGSQDASTTELLKLGGKKLKGKLPSNPLKKKKK